MPVMDFDKKIPFIMMLPIFAVCVITAVAIVHTKNREVGANPYLFVHAIYLSLLLLFFLSLSAWQLFSEEIPFGATLLETC